MATDQGASEGADPVEELMAAFLAGRSGAAPGAPEIEELIERHPEHAAELRARFEVIDALENVHPAPDEPELPERLGDFQLLGRIGKGGMGIVYRARQLSLGREVALKLVRPEHMFFPGARERFRREVEAVARLKHEGIVPVYTVGEERGIPYFAMELLEGCTLADILARLHGRAPESLSGKDLGTALRERARIQTPGPASELSGTWQEVCLRITQQVALALHHAHTQGVVHRDVKPSNIALLPSGRAMLLDFGLTSSSEQERMTRTGSQVGTLYYMAPEQLRGGKEIDARSDVYALGVTLYELLTLQVPFQGENALETQRLILGGTPDALRARNRRISSEAETVCLQAMALEPQHRYQDAAAFARDLENVLELRPIEARPPGALRKLGRWVQRNPSRAAAVALGGLLVAGVPGSYLWQQRAHAAELEDALAKESEARAKESAALTKETEALAQERVARDDAEVTLNFLLNMVNMGAPGEGRTSDPRLSEFLARGIGELDQLDGRPRIKARVLQILGQVYMLQGRYEDARALIEDALPLEEQVYGPVSDELALSINNLATVLWRQGELQRGEELFLRALDLQRELHGDESVAVGTAHNNLASLLTSRGRYDEAIEHLMQACRIVTEAEDADAEWRASPLSNLAYLLMQRGELESAEDLVQQALTILEEGLTPPQPCIANTLNIAGMIRRRRGDVAGARALFERALAMMRELYPNGHDSMAVVVLNLAAALEAQGERERARALAEESLAMLLRIGGPDHPEVAPTRALIEALGGG